MEEQERLLQNAMEAHGGAVYRLALCRLQNVQDAEDVYQDVFLRLLGQPAQDWDGEHLKAWLLRTAVNRCADIGRWRLRRRTLALSEIAEVGRDADGAGTELWDAVARLPQKLRVVVHLYYAEGYSTEELAALLDCPASTVRTRLRRAREKLQKLLKGDDYEQDAIQDPDGARTAPGGAE